MGDSMRAQWWEEQEEWDTAAFAHKDVCEDANCGRLRGCLWGCSGGVPSCAFTDFYWAGSGVPPGRGSDRVPFSFPGLFLCYFSSSWWPELHPRDTGLPPWDTGSVRWYVGRKGRVILQLSSNLLSLSPSRAMGDLFVPLWPSTICCGPFCHSQRKGFWKWVLLPVITSPDAGDTRKGLEKGHWPLEAPGRVGVLRWSLAGMDSGQVWKGEKEFPRGLDFSTRLRSLRNLVWLRPLELVREGAQLRLGRCRILDFIKRRGQVPDS